MKWHKSPDAVVQAFNHCLPVVAGVERKAFRMAHIALRDEDDALDAVQDAMLQLDSVPDKQFHGKVKALSGTATAPIETVAQNATTHSGRLRIAIATRSPRSTPMSVRRAASVDASR